MKQLALTFSLIGEIYVNTFDKGNTPYVCHCIFVWEGVLDEDEDTQCAALLHDAVEDKKLTREDLADLNFSNKTRQIIDNLTHNKEIESYDDYIKRVANSLYRRETVKIKLRDLKHNSDISRVKGLSKDDFDRLEKYVRSFHYLKSINN